MAKSKAESNQQQPMKDSINYADAISELEAIVSEIENEEISVDDLAEKVKRASILIKVCKDKLTKTETEVSEALKEMKAGSGSEQEDPKS